MELTLDNLDFERRNKWLTLEDVIDAGNFMMNMNAQQNKEKVIF